MRALITGGAGFIGFALARELEKLGWSVHLVDNFSRGQLDAEITNLSEKEHVTLSQINLLDPHSIESLGTGFDIIFHLAAIVGVSNVLSQPTSVLNNNVELLKIVLELGGRQKHLKRFLFPSTSEVYAGSVGYFDSEFPIPTPESAPIVLPALSAPRTSYMLSKIYGEAMVINSGLPATIIRPHNVYGPRMGLNHVIPELLLKLSEQKNGGEVTVFSPAHTRTFCFIEDAVQMLISLSTSDNTLGDTFNLGCQSPEITISKLAELIKEVCGSRATLKMGGETAGSPTRRCPDMTKTLAAINYEPQTSLLAGLEKTCAWYIKRADCRPGLTD